MSQEYTEIEANPPQGITIQPIDEDMFKWNIEITGPKESIYAVSSHTDNRFSCCQVVVE